jgi:hypothetical protein
MPPQARDAASTHIDIGIDFLYFVDFQAID